MRPNRLGPAALLIAALAACTPQETDPEPLAEKEEMMPAPADSGPLVPTLQAEQFPDSVRLHLRVTNASGEPVPLTFNTGQSFDFVVLQGDEEVWRWSADRMFTQAIRNEAIGAGETLEYSAIWTPPAEAGGNFTVRATLAAQEHRVEQETEVTLP